MRLWPKPTYTLDEVHQYSEDIHDLVKLRDKALADGDLDLAEDFYNTIEVATLTLQRLLEQVG